MPTPLTGEEGFRLLVESVEDLALFMLGPEGRIASWNAGAERITGYTAEDVRGVHVSRVYLEEDLATGAPRRVLAEAEARGWARTEGWRVRKDGSRFYSLTHYTVMRDAEGQLLGFAGMTRDLTARRETEARLHEALESLRRNETLSKMGALVAGVAHEELNPFLGESRAIRELEATARRLLDSDSPVLIQGETGSGKGVLATWLHQHGSRAAGPLVQLNCAGLSPQFLDTELFGHERGAFTGAIGRKQGLLEVAHRGSVFLDEIGDMDSQVQPKLLKVLEEKHFRRLGEVEDRSVDVRLIAATHHDLAQAVRAQRFRGDLYFRISTLPLQLPALRERPEDLPVIARDMLARLSRELGRPRLDLTPDAEAALRTYAWPGNLRELRNVLERAVLLSSSPVLRPGDLQFNHAMARALSPPPPCEGAELDVTLQELERGHIARVLAAESGHVERAARRLGIPRSSLYQKLKRLGLSSKV
jgi:PAS domain S-box-containing protein